TTYRDPFSQEHSFFFSSRRRHTRFSRDWSSDVCSSDLLSETMTDPFKEADATRKVLTVPEEAEGRVDAWLAATLAGDFSRSRIKALIEEGAVRVNGAAIGEPKRKIHPGDRIEIALPEPRDPEPKAEDIPLDVLYEDDDLIVICKPAGLVV